MTSRLHFSAAEARVGLGPAELGLAFTSLRRLELAGGGVCRLEAGREERCLVLISGGVNYRVVLADGRRETGAAAFKDMLFLPPGSRAELQSEAPAVLMSYSAPSELGADWAHLSFSRIDADPAVHHVYGKAETGCQRDVWNYVDAGFRCSRLMLGICEGRPGGWTAWPPHEHAEQREEVYVYFDMGVSFGLQCVYENLTSPLAVDIVRDGDVISIPRGYHPNLGSPAGRICYIYCMTARVPGRRDFMDLRIQPEFGEKFE